MKSYSIQATIALLVLQLGCTMAASSSRRRLSLAVNADMPEAGGFAYSEYSDPDTYGYGSTTIRGATYGAAKVAKTKSDKKTKAPKKEKSKYFGKDCPMSPKTPKSKGKSYKSGEPTPEPSEVPSAQPISSEFPSSAPSESFEPSWAWCQDSAEPSEPTVPAVTAVPGGSVPGGSKTALCENRGADYSDDGTITIFSGGDTRTSAAVAALAEDVGDSVRMETTKTYNVGVTVEITGDAGALGEQMDATVSPPTTLVLVDCQGKAAQVAFDHYTANNVERRLEEKDGTLSVMKNWECSGTGPGSECFTTVNYIGTLDEADFTARLKFALIEYLQMLDNVAPDLYPKQTISVNDISVTETTSDVNGVIGSNQNKQGGIRAGPFIGAATGMLAVLLLLVLFVRRRNRFDEQVSHLKLDDDDTFYNGSEGTGLEREYETRDIHIVGEGDSVISHWTGFTGRSKQPSDSFERDGLMRGRSTDVHQCSSATCEICDKKRQAGVQFVKTHSPTVPQRIHSLPSDASREYIAEDTVQL